MTRIAALAVRSAFVAVPLIVSVGCSHDKMKDGSMTTMPSMEMKPMSKSDMMDKAQDTMDKGQKMKDDAMKMDNGTMMNGMTKDGMMMKGDQMMKDGQMMKDNAMKM